MSIDFWGGLDPSTEYVCVWRGGTKLDPIWAIPHSLNNWGHNYGLLGYSIKLKNPKPKPDPNENFLTWV